MYFVKKKRKKMYFSKNVLSYLKNKNKFNIKKWIKIKNINIL